MACPVLLYGMPRTRMMFHLETNAWTDLETKFGPLSVLIWFGTLSHAIAVNQCWIVALELVLVCCVAMITLLYVSMVTANQAQGINS